MWGRLDQRITNPFKAGSQTRGPQAACGPRGPFVRPAMLFGNFQIINIYIVKYLEKRCREIIESRLTDIQCGFRPGRSTTDQISLTSKFLRNLGSMPKTSAHSLSTWESIRLGSLWKDLLWSVPRVWCWRPSSYCIHCQKFVSVSGELNHDRWPLLLDSHKGVCCHRSFSLSTSGLHNSETRRAQLTTLICRGPQMSISFRCGDFVVLSKKFWNNNYLVEVELVPHFLQLRKLSRATRNAFADRMLCRRGRHELDRPVVLNRGGIPPQVGILCVQDRNFHFLSKLPIHCKCCTSFLSWHWPFQLGTSLYICNYHTFFFTNFNAIIWQQILFVPLVLIKLLPLIETIVPILAHKPEQGRNERSIGEEYNAPKWAKGGVHQKILGTTGIDSHSGADKCVTVGTAGSTVCFLQTIWYCEHHFNSLQHALDRFSAASERAGMKINTKNTEVLLYVSLQTQGSGNTLQQVEKFKHLRVVFASEGRWSKEIDTRIGEANVFLDELYRSVVTKRVFSNTTKLSVFKSVFVPILTYGPESWVITKRTLTQVQAPEMGFLRSHGVTQGCIDVRWHPGQEACPSMFEPKIFRE